MAREFSTSRGTVSAAVSALARDGLVTQSPGRGTHVLPPMDRLSGSSVVGILHSSHVASSAPWPKTASIIQGIRDTLSRLGHRHDMRSITASEISPDMIPEQYGAAIFVETFGCQAQILELEERRVPLVVASLEIALEVTATFVDHRQTTLDAVSMLAALGHRRIAFLGREPRIFFYGQAKEGYVAGLHHAGIPFHKSLVAVSEHTDPLSAYFATVPLLKAPEPPTAIVVARDVLAQGACRAIEEGGFMIGRDISVISFDDFSWPLDEPFLTTFHEPCYEMGAAAAEMLSDRIVTGWKPPEKRKLKAPFILRRSAGPLITGKETYFQKTGRPEVETVERCSASE